MGKSGLSFEEAVQRLKIYGPNKVQFFKIDLLEILKRNSLNFFNFLLFIAILLSLLIKGLEIETIIILFFLLSSIVISTFQDYKSNKLAEKLLSYFKNYAWVKREGRWEKILQEKIVPGDYVKVSAGYLVPADIKILKAEDIFVDESLITGESTPLYKGINDTLFMGTIVLKGEAEGEVIATGKNSYFGSLAKKTLEIKKESGYQKLLSDFAKKIGYLAIFLIIILNFVNLFKSQPPDFKEMIIFSIVLAVAIVPELLPPMTVLTLSLAGERLAKKGLIIKRLSALEDLGVVQVLCTDKTGTITTNELKLEKIISEDKETFIKYFLADYYFTKEITPYEKAVLEKNEKTYDYSDLTFIEDIDFDPVKKIEKIIVKKGNHSLEIIKGAPEEIINLSQEKEKWFGIFRKEDEAGLRTLALGIKKDTEFEFLGIASFYDPIKESAFPAVNLAKKLNLEIKILTGDSAAVAKAVALKLGIINEKEDVILGENLRNLNEEELKQIVTQNKVFARVSPDDKLKIIETLQKEKLVAFLGEGINDAPALKISHSALVVDSANDVTKEEADIILKEKNLKVIVEGILEGRRILENISKYIKHTMSDNFGNLTSVAVLSSILPFVPMTPLQILLTNFLTDIPLIAFANDNVELKEIKKPLRMSSKHLIMLLLVLGLIAGIINILGYLIVRKEPIEIIRTFIFFLTTMTGLLVSFLIRTKDWFIFSKPAKSFILSSILGIILTLIFVFFSPFKEIFSFASFDSKLLSYSFLLILIFVLATEIAKKIFYQKFSDVI